MSAISTFVAVPEECEFSTIDVVWMSRMSQSGHRLSQMIHARQQWKDIGSPRYLRVTMEPLTEEQYREAVS